MTDYICYRNNNENIIENFQEKMGTAAINVIATKYGIFSNLIDVSGNNCFNAKDSCGWTLSNICSNDPWYEPILGQDIKFYANTPGVKCDNTIFKDRTNSSLIRSNGSCISNGCTTGDKDFLKKNKDICWERSQTDCDKLVCKKLLETYPTIDATDVNKPFLDICVGAGHIPNNSYTIKNSNFDFSKFLQDQAEIIPGVPNLYLYIGLGVLVLIVILKK